MKDLFSGHADIYAAFRPTYPVELYEYVFSFVRSTNTAWDCGTGNGQVAQVLAQKFDQVFATDISEKQIAHAVILPNISYAISPAEKTGLPDHSIDLITVGQALHWFDREKFFSEAARVGKPGSVLAIWGYGNIQINDLLDPLILEFYSNVVGKYWDGARRHVESGYNEIAFPFDVIRSPGFFIRQEWSIGHLKGYLESWSATQKFMLERNENPIPEIERKLREKWGDREILPVRFPIFLKLGILK